MRRRKNREIFSCVRILFNFDWHFLSSSSSALSCRLLSHTVSSSKGFQQHTKKRRCDVHRKKVFLPVFDSFSSLFLPFFFHQRGKVARIFLSPLSFIFWLIYKEPKSPHVKLFVFTHFLQSLQLWSQYSKLQACDKCAPAVQPPFDNTKRTHCRNALNIYFYLSPQSGGNSHVIAGSPRKKQTERELSVSHDSD